MHIIYNCMLVGSRVIFSTICVLGRFLNMIKFFLNGKIKFYSDRKDIYNLLYAI